MRRPLIGVTTGLQRSGARERPGPKPAYRRAIYRAGGSSILLPPGPAKDLNAAWTRLDGLLLTGGGDVDPARYGEKRHPRTGYVSAARDAAEIRLIERALRDRRPVFAICRGIQILNVALGGTLIQDIPSEPGRHLPHAQSAPRDRVTHRVRILGEKTRLETIAGSRVFTTNSFHHQAVRRPGRDLRIVARAADGIVEAVEPVDDMGFMLGVQWHPEATAANDPISRRLFHAFIVACRGARQRPPGASPRMPPARPSR